MNDAKSMQTASNTLEDGQYGNLTNFQVIALRNLDLIYCAGPNHYRFTDGICYVDIELALKGLPNQ